MISNLFCNIFRKTPPRTIICSAGVFSALSNFSSKQTTQIQTLFPTSDGNSNNQNGNPLIDAVHRGDKKAVERLLEAGAKINAQNQDGETALLVAARRGRKELVEFLIKWGADVNIKDREGETALMLATKCRNKELVAVLVGGGADINLKDKYGNTALMKAAWVEHTEIIDFLKAYSTTKY